MSYQTVCNNIHAVGLYFVSKYANNFVKYVLKKVIKKE